MPTQKSTLQGPFDPEWDLPQFDILELEERRTRYCLVIPVMNQGSTLHSQLARMLFLKGQADIILADTCSTDGSTEEADLKRLGVRTLLRNKVRGHSYALQMGFAYALREGYEGIITMDGNGKDGVEAIPRIIEQLEAGIDLVQASRFLQGSSAKHTPIDRLVGIRFILAPILSLTSGLKITDPTNLLKGHSRNFLLDPFVQPFRRTFDSYQLQPYLTYRAGILGFRYKEIAAARDYSAQVASTKIVSFMMKLKVLRDYLGVACGKYNPE